MARTHAQMTPCQKMNTNTCMQQSPALSKGNRQLEEYSPAIQTVKRNVMSVKLGGPLVSAEQDR